MADTQEIDSGENVVFDTSADALDVAGTGITLDASGTVFTIDREGLYHLEWSLNLDTATEPVVVGLMEIDFPSSALSNINTTGNYSSGGLINLTPADLPYTVSLHNFGAAMSIENPLPFTNTAGSIRIARFADGAN